MDSSRKIKLLSRISDWISRNICCRLCSFFNFLTQLKPKPVINEGLNKKLKFILKAKDGFELELEGDVAYQSNLLKKIVIDLKIEDPDHPFLKTPIPVDQVNGFGLQKISDWCILHRNEVYVPKRKDEDPRIELTRRDAVWMNVSAEMLCDLLLAAHYLDIPGIVDIIIQKVANIIEGSTVKELRGLLGLETDFTFEEEEAIRQRWAGINQYLSFSH